MNKKFRVDILTPFGKYLSTDADYLSVSTSMGVIGILPNHAPLISTVEISKLEIRDGNSKLIFAVGGGLIHIKEGTNVVLLLDSIERSDEIDVARALEAKKRADDRLSRHSDDIDVARAKAALSRALNRLSVSNETDI